MEQSLSKSDLQHGNDHEVYRKEQQQKELEKDVIPQLLKLVAEADAILHNPIEEMSLADICSNETKQIVANMIYSIRPEQLKSANAPYNKAAGMAANQWNMKKRIFLFCPNGSDGEVKVIFNPTYKPMMPTQSPIDESKSTTTDQFTNFCKEGCFSVPHAYGTVERYTYIEISYVDDKGIQHTNEQLSGWQARVWQHETDHLNGILYSNRQSGMNNGPNCIELCRFQTKTEFETHCKKNNTKL
jgi:peptide deformylase